MFNDFCVSSSPNSFTVVNVNIGNVRKHWIELKAVFDEIHDDIDAFVLTEINISSDYLPQFRFSVFQNFVYTRLDTRGGRIGTFGKDFWSATQVDTVFMHSALKKSDC